MDVLKEDSQTRVIIALQLFALMTRELVKTMYLLLMFNHLSIKDILIINTMAITITMKDLGIELNLWLFLAEILVNVMRSWLLSCKMLLLLILKELIGKLIRQD